MTEGRGVASQTALKPVPHLSTQGAGCGITRWKFELISDTQDGVTGPPRSPWWALSSPPVTQSEPQAPTHISQPRWKVEESSKARREGGTSTDKEGKL